MPQRAPATDADQLQPKKSYDKSINMVIKEIKVADQVNGEDDLHSQGSVSMAKTKIMKGSASSSRQKTALQSKRGSQYTVSQHSSTGKLRAAPQAKP